jgi:hypothetical protein
LKAHNNRIDRGTILFGKYYRALWDWVWSFLF